MSEIVHNNNDGTIVCNKKVYSVDPTKVSNLEGISFCASILALIAATIVTACIFPWFAAVGVLFAGGTAFWQTFNRIDEYQRVRSFLKENSFSLSCKRSDVALKLVGLKRGSLTLNEGIYRSDYKPSEVEGKGRRYHRSGMNLDDMDYEYDYTLVLDKKKKKGLVLEQHFSPRPVTMWDHALNDSRALHNL